MQLFQHLPEFHRDRQSQICGIFHQRQTFITQIEENNRRIEGFYFNVERILDVYEMKYCYEEGDEIE